MRKMFYIVLCCTVVVVYSTVPQCPTHHCMSSVVAWGKREKEGKQEREVTRLPKEEEEGKKGRGTLSCAQQREKRILSTIINSVHAPVLVLYSRAIYLNNNAKLDEEILSHYCTVVEN